MGPQFSIHVSIYQGSYFGYTFLTHCHVTGLPGWGNTSPLPSLGSRVLVESGGGCASAQVGSSIGMPPRNGKPRERGRSSACSRRLEALEAGGLGMTRATCSKPNREDEGQQGAGSCGYPPSQFSIWFWVDCVSDVMGHTRFWTIGHCLLGSAPSRAVSCCQLEQPMFEDAGVRLEQDMAMLVEANVSSELWRLAGENPRVR